MFKENITRDDSDVENELIEKLAIKSRKTFAITPSGKSCGSWNKTAFQEEWKAVAKTIISSPNLLAYLKEKHGLIEKKKVLEMLEEKYGRLFLFGKQEEMLDAIKKDVEAIRNGQV